MVGGPFEVGVFSDGHRRVLCDSHLDMLSIGSILHLRNLIRNRHHFLHHHHPRNRRCGCCSYFFNLLRYLDIGGILLDVANWNSRHGQITFFLNNSVFGDGVDFYISVFDFG